MKLIIKTVHMRILESQNMYKLSEGNICHIIKQKQ